MEAECVSVLALEKQKVFVQNEKAAFCANFVTNAWQCEETGAVGPAFDRNGRGHDIAQRISHSSVSRQALPGVMNRACTVRSILRRFKSRIQLRDEFMEQVEVPLLER